LIFAVDCGLFIISQCADKLISKCANVQMWQLENKEIILKITLTRQTHTKPSGTHAPISRCANVQMW